MIYEVLLTQKDMYEFTVDANSEEEAKQIAIDLFDVDKSKYFSDSDTEIEIYKV